ncbi:hypothetical protein [Schlesneria sp. T3-172]|uniref:hypothetical protein n=1 Tax=Schlesneria sphaerica TaxID=3373610 RepID=UPI0037CC78D5
MQNLSWHKSPVVRFRLANLLVLIAFFLPGFVRAQTEAETTTPARQEQTEDESGNDFRFSIAWVSTGGSYIFVPEKWSELHINLVNSRNEPRELVCATYFDEQPTLQYSRRVWVPAKSTLSISHPVVIPKTDPAKGRAVSLHTLVLDASSKDEVFLKNQSGQNLHDGVLNVTHATRNTGVIGTSTGGEEIPSKAISDLIRASRVSQQLPNGYVLMLDTFLPGDIGGLDGFDQMVIVDNRITDDFAALSALRAWVNSGGRLWVMLDKVDPVVLERILGDDFAGAVIDRVGLTSVRVDKLPTLADLQGVVGETREFEEPVDFVRMDASNLDVTHAVNGWPAAMSRPCGEGRVFITTLGARGWIVPRPETEKQSADPLYQTEFVPTAPMYDIAADFFSRREADLLPPANVEPQMREYVGYTIPSWNLVVGILFGFSVLLVGSSLALLKTGQLEHLGWIGSLFAILASILLISIGRTYRHAIPPTVSSLQLARAVPGTDEVVLEGIIGAFHPEGSTERIEVNKGGQFMPDMAGLEGSARRMVSTDLGTWHWENLPQPAGLRTAPFLRSETVPQRLEARATFDASGVTGKYTGILKPGTDPLIATHEGRLGVTLNSNGTFSAPAEAVFKSNQFLSADLISDEQDRHRRTFEKLLANPKRKDYPNRPQLMFWSDEWAPSIRFGENLHSRGATLVAIPLILERPEEGTEFLIPSPFLSMHNRTHPDGTPASTMWSYTQQEWQERAQPGTSWLKIQVPKELLPLQASRARIDFRVSGPVGRIEILGLKDGQVTSVQAVNDPVGELAIDVTDTDILKIAEDGELTLGLIAGDTRRKEAVGDAAGGKKSLGDNAFDPSSKVNYWRIESMTLQLWVKATEQVAKD